MGFSAPTGLKETSDQCVFSKSFWTGEMLGAGGFVAAGGWLVCVAQAVSNLTKSSNKGYRAIFCA
jgi:hypothetical protein